MKLSLAPIQGITFAHYRNIFSEIFGSIDTYYAPFIATTDMRDVNPIIFKDLFPSHNTTDKQIVPQLLSNTGLDFRYYASRIVAMGYKEINWNIGCPYQGVTKKLKGSGLLAHPDRIKNFLDEVCQDNTYKLTVKMRLGLNDLEQGKKVMAILNEYPLSGVTIHARTGIQKYEGHVDLDGFGELFKTCKHETTYNGDIITLQNFNDIQARFPSLNKFMLGRGALMDPFLPSEIKGNTLANDLKLGKIKMLHEAIYHFHASHSISDQHLCDKMKEFWLYNSIHLDPSGTLLTKIKRSGSLKAYWSYVEQILSPSNAWRDGHFSNQLKD